MPVATFALITKVVGSNPAPATKNIESCEGLSEARNVRALSFLQAWPICGPNMAQAWPANFNAIYSLTIGSWPGFTGPEPLHPRAPLQRLQTAAGGRCVHVALQEAVVR